MTEDQLAPYYFQHEDQIICGQSVTPITNEYVENFPSVVDRFFKRYYFLKPGRERAPYQVLFHTNRICLICLAPEHPALKSGIRSITFDIGNADRSKNIVSGKGKKGGMPLQSDSILAILTDENDVVYKIPSCIRGKLIEVNLGLIDNPKMLETSEEGAAYLAVILPKPENCDEIKQSLMTQEQYEEYLINDK